MQIIALIVVATAMFGVLKLRYVVERKQPQYCQPGAWGLEGADARADLSDHPERPAAPITTV